MLRSKRTRNYSTFLRRLLGKTSVHGHIQVTLAENAVQYEKKLCLMAAEQIVVKVKKELTCRVVVTDLS